MAVRITDLPELGPTAGGAYGSDLVNLQRLDGSWTDLHTDFLSIQGPIRTKIYDFTLPGNFNDLVHEPAPDELVVPLSAWLSYTPDPSPSGGTFQAQFRNYPSINILGMFGYTTGTPGVYNLSEEYSNQNLPFMGLDTGLYFVGTNNGSAGGPANGTFRAFVQYAVIPKVFVCVGGVRIVTTQEYNIQASTSTGYLSRTSTSSPLSVLGSGDPSFSIFQSEGPTSYPTRTYCFAACDGSGNLVVGPSGGFDGTLFCEYNGVDRIEFDYSPGLFEIQLVCSNLQEAPDLSAIPNLFAASLFEWPFASMDLAFAQGLASLDISSSPSLTSVDLPQSPLLYYLAFTGCSIADSDSVIQHMYDLVLNLGNSPGYIELAGGSNAPRTSASDVAYNYLTSVGWVISHN